MGLIIDKVYYRNTWVGQDTDDASLDKAINRAEDIIQLSIRDPLSSITINDYLRKAVASQAEYNIINGGSNYYDDGNEVKSAKIGDFTYTTEKKSGSNVTSKRNAMMNEMSYQFLVRGGYTYRGLNEGCLGGVANCVY